MNPPVHDLNCLLTVQLPFKSAGMGHGNMACSPYPALCQAAYTKTLRLCSEAEGGGDCVQRGRTTSRKKSLLVTETFRQAEWPAVYNQEVLQYEPLTDICLLIRRQPQRSVSSGMWYQSSGRSACPTYRYVQMRLR